MLPLKSEILSQLQKQILPLQGFKSLHQHKNEINLGPILQSFPEKCFPQAAIHEFLSPHLESFASTGGFISGIIGEIMKTGGLSIWIHSGRTIFPPALKFYGISPDKIIFIHLRKTKDILWAFEESLAYKGLAAVIADIPDLDLTASRRLQLVVEQSRVTGFLIRNKPENQVTASLSRWKIEPLPSSIPDKAPGVGFPKWKVELLKIRNGKPGCWEMEWVAGKFNPVEKQVDYQERFHQKTG